MTGERELNGFLTTVGFPRQGLVVHTEAHPADAVKGITDLPALHDAIAAATFRHPDEQVLVVTDQRAHHNPRRRGVIRAAATDLAARLASHCPACASPGYGTEASEPGRLRYVRHTSSRDRGTDLVLPGLLFRTPRSCDRLRTPDGVRSATPSLSPSQPKPRRSEAKPHWMRGNRLTAT